MIEVNILAFCPTPLRPRGRYMEGPCPLPACSGGTDRFCIKDRYKWYCRYCSGGKYLDGVDFLQRLHGLTFVAACRMASVTPDLTNRPEWKPSPVPLTEEQEPDRKKQAQWNTYIKQAVLSLWSPAGKRALAWLHARGLNDETLSRHCIGYDPRGRRSITIPWLLEGRPWGVRKRFAVGKPKYSQLVGSKPLLYIAREHNGGPVWVGEGEWDSLLVQQESAGLCGVATLGSASARVSAQAEFWLRGASRVLLQMDNDAAGDRAFRKFLQVWPNAERVPVLFGGDVTEFFAQGGIISNQIQIVLSPDSMATEVLKLFPGSRVVEVTA